MIAASFQRVFPRCLVVLGGESSQTPSIGLCAWKDDTPWQTELLQYRIEEVRRFGSVRDRLVLNPQLLVCGVLKEGQYQTDEVNTLDNAKLELEAGRFWLLKDLRSSRTPDDLSNGFLSGPNLKRFLQKLFEQTDPVLNPIHRKQLLRALK